LTIVWFSTFSQRSLPITTDNGGAFSDYKEMCKALRKINRFLKVYYTHAYAAWEK